MSDVIEAVAEAIEPPRVLGEADKWLAEKRAQVEEAARGLNAFEIADAQGYKDSKRQRAAVRQAMSSIDAERKSMTARLTAALREFKAGADSVCAPLAELDAAYKAEQARWEDRVVGARMSMLEAAYEETYPDIAAHAPFPVVAARFAKEGKWANVGTGDAKALESLAGFIEGPRGVMAELATIDAADGDEAVKDAVKASYFADLDLTRAMTEVNARRAAEARLARERAEREEWERRQREEAERRAAEQAAEDARRAAQGGASAPQGAMPAPAPEQPATWPESAPQAPAPGAEGFLVFEVRVPRAAFARFRAAMVDLGAHGKLIRKE